MAKDAVDAMFETLAGALAGLKICKTAVQWGLPDQN